VTTTLTRKTEERIPVVTTTTWVAIAPKADGTKINVNPVTYAMQPNITTIATCLVDHGKGQGLPDTENETKCVEVCEDLPVKPVVSKDELVNLFNEMKTNPGYLSQVVTHPLDALERKNIRLSQKQVVLISSLSSSDLQGGFSALSQESQNQLLDAGSASGGDMATSVCYGESCTTKPTPDGIPDVCDNCPTEQNADQADGDGDGVGDFCDNCPGIENPYQEDSDFDNIGDACDICPGKSCTDPYGKPDNGDDDKDGRGNCCDTCKKFANPNQEDADGDGIGNACDNCWDQAGGVDSDGDCIDVKKKDPGYWTAATGWLKDPKCCAAYDNCPIVYNPDQADADSDGLGDACDKCQGVTNVDPTDSDYDEIPDACDNCPSAFQAYKNQTDSDGDGVGNACDCDDRIKGTYEYATDCGVRNVTQYEEYRAKLSIESGKAGCPSQPCNPCEIQGNSNFSWTEWRGKNWMSPPTDQGQCGSCWVHSPINVMEAMYNIHSGKSIGGNQWDALGDTVPKNNMEYNNQLAYWIVTNNAEGSKCGGGQNNNAMSWINSYGVPDRLNAHHYRITGYMSVQDDCCGGVGNSPAGELSGDTMIRYLKCRGPLSICTPFWEWKADEEEWGGHCFVLVGYDPNQFGGTGAWIIKNNWGTGWPGPGTPITVPGHDGYAYFAVQQGQPGWNYMKGTFSSRPLLFTGAAYEG
jgi:C1A family cysteine protease